MHSLKDYIEAHQNQPCAEPEPPDPTEVCEQCGGEMSYLILSIPSIFRCKKCDHIEIPAERGNIINCPCGCMRDH